MIPPILRVLCLLLAFSAARSEVAVPDTQAGRNFAALLEAVNSRDHNVVREYVADYGRGESVDAILRSTQRVGALTLTRIVKSEPLRLQFIVANETTDVELLGLLEVEDTEPARMTIALPWLPIQPFSSALGFDVDAPTRSRVIEAIAAYLTEYYALAEPGANMAQALTEHATNGDYDGITNGWVLANSLTAHMRNVAGDQHLVVGFSPIAAGPPLPGSLTARAAGATRLERIDERFELSLPHAHPLNSITSNSSEQDGEQPAPRRAPSVDALAVSAGDAPAEARGLIPRAPQPQ